MSEPPATPGKTIVIGAGLAGLSCAIRLHEAGRDVEVFEASDTVGGRVRTDEVDGFLLDRGFQVYLDSYETAGDFLDLDALDLRRFEPGALVWKQGKMHAVRDVFRQPGALFRSAAAPIGNLFDKARVARLRSRLLRKSIDEIWNTPQQSTADYLREFGFSDRMIDDFFRGFYGGIFLEDLLVTSSRIFEFTFKMFSAGHATLPARGMRAIPEQLASRLPDRCLHFHCPVRSIEETTIRLEDAVIEGSQVVVATDGSVANQLVPEIPQPRWNSTTCIYYAAEQAPVIEPLIVLKGDREGLINNLCVPSQVAPGYAPTGQCLISLSLLGDHSDSEDLENRVREELRDWFGEEATHWRHLRTEHIRQALPVDPPGHLAALPRPRGLHICGDHTTTGSIEGAIQSGLRVAETILNNDE